MTDRRRPTHPMRPRPAAAPAFSPEPRPPERRTLEAILRAESSGQAEAAATAGRAAFEALAGLVEALDRGEGLDRALQRARALLKRRA
jgi:hypothetical protein